MVFKPLTMPRVLGWLACDSVVTGAACTSVARPGDRPFLERQLLETRSPGHFFTGEKFSLNDHETRASYRAWLGRLCGPRCSI
ncbi:MAG: hypothetical protein JWQ32_3585 [Marmoricola sp.]|nr:hypothetical protein [Marmoricola sp.]